MNVLLLLALLFSSINAQPAFICETPCTHKDGTVDNTFGTDGVTITDFNHDEDSIQALALQKNGYIIAAGRINPGVRSFTGDFGLIRYHNCAPCCNS